MKCKSLGIITQIFIYVVFSTATKKVANFWDVMHQLDEINRRSLRQLAKSNGPLDTPKYVTGTPSSNEGSNGPKQTTENIKSYIYSTTESTSTPVLLITDGVTKEQFNNNLNQKDQPTMATAEHENTVPGESDNIDKFPLTKNDKDPVFGESKTNVSNVPSDNIVEKFQDNNGKKILWCSGIVVGVILAVLCVIGVLYVQQKRRNRTKKERFSTTDQKTYQDTKIFVMANSNKSDIPSFDAIPSDTYLWKELRSTTSNVF